jgi:tetratricopeptide (TPR) repeat protein
VAKRKKRQTEDSAARTLEEIERESDRLAEWIDTNQMLLLGIVGGVLVVAAIVGFSMSGREAAREAAALELADLQVDYRVAMGAAPAAFEIAEPANPETAVAVRTEYLSRFEALAQENAGTTVGAMAALDQSRIQEALGDSEGALVTIEAALDELGRGKPAHSLLEARRAALFEEAGLWGDAAGAWESAASESGPLTGEWLANAARCWAEAGERDKALAAWKRFESLAIQTRVPPYVRARIEELEAGA